MSYSSNKLDNHNLNEKQSDNRYKYVFINYNKLNFCIDNLMLDNNQLFPKKQVSFPMHLIGIRLATETQIKMIKILQ